MFISRSIKCKKTCTSFALILLILAFSYGTFGGCGDYDTPVTTQTDPLIDAATLKDWMDKGYVNGTGFDRVVILDINPWNDKTTGLYTTTGHIPGAHYVGMGVINITETREDGVGVTSSYMVLDGPSMDALIQRYGIGVNTTVVFTSASSDKAALMGYFLFRYWGFPKNRLKVLDGRNDDFDANYGLTAVEPPLPAPSSYSVRNNPSFKSSLRASFPEMIDVVEGRVPNAFIMQASGGITTSTPFKGTIKNAQVLAYTNVLDAVNPEFFDSPSNLIADFAGIGLDSSKTAYIYCNSSYMAAVTFFALDGILGWPVVLYNGSWFEWGQMADNANPTNGKGIDTTSPWRTDTAARSESASIVYNPDAGVSRYSSAPESFDTTVNQIEQEDAAYWNSGHGDGSGGGGGGNPGC